MFSELPSPSQSKTMRDYKRGQLMLGFLKHEVRKPRNFRLLDLGAGEGGITIALSEWADSLCALDKDAENAKACGRAISAVDGRLNVDCLRGLGEALPFRDESFDLVVLNGVLEWIGSIANDPYKVQRIAIGEIARVLRPAGYLYTAIENRLFPGFLILDPHTHYLLANAMPRGLARLLSKLTKRPPFGNFIYSYWGLRKMLTASFSKIRFYLPLPHYHIPIRMIPLDSSRAVRAAAKSLLDSVELPARLRLTLAYDRLTARWGLSRIASPYFVVLAQKE